MRVAPQVSWSSLSTSGSFDTAKQLIEGGQLITQARDLGVTSA